MSTDLPGSVRSRELQTLYEPLTDKVMGNLLAAVGNNEGKAYTGLLLDDIPRGADSLHTLFVEGQGEEVVYVGHSLLQFDYCDQTLERVGLVARHHVDGDEIKFTKTEFGERTGDALIGLLLDFSLRHPEIRLKDLFGSAQTRGKTRAAESRMKIFRALAGQDASTRKNGLSERTGLEPPLLERALSTLGATGLIGYEAVPPDHHPDEYQISADNISRSSTWPRPGALTDFLLQAVELAHAEKKSIITNDEMRDYLKAKGIDQRAAAPKRFLLTMIAGRNKLEEKGILTPLQPHNSDKVLSNIDLTNEQLEIFRELVQIIDGIQSQDATTIAKGHQLASDIRTSPEKIKKLLKKHYDKSRYVKSLPDELLISIMHQVFERLPEQTLSADDVARLLEVKGYNAPRPESISRRLSKLATHQATRLIKQPVRGRIFYASSHR